MASTASTTTSLGGVAQRGLDGGCVMMDAHRAVALFGVVAASTAGRPDKDDADLFSEDGLAVRWWWRFLKRVHMVYALGLLHRAHDPGAHRR